MSRNWKLAILLAITISACGTLGSVYAGGHGHSGGGSGGRSGGHSGHGGGFGGGSSRMSGGFNSGGFKPSGGFNPSGGFKPSNGSNGSGGVVRSGNLGGVNLGGLNGSKGQPKNTGVVGPITKINGSNSGVSGVLRNISGTNNGSSNNAKKGNVNIGQIMKQPGLGGLGINLGGKFPGGGNGNGNGNGNGQGNGNGNGPGNGNGNGNGHGHHNHHHHCWPPIVLTLPPCQPNYCPPPPIYYPQPYPQPYPVGVPVGDPLLGPPPGGEPVVVNNSVSVTSDVKPLEPGGKPAETTKPAEQTVSTEAPPADTKPAEPKPADVATKDATQEAPLPKIPVGATLTLQGKDLSEKQGQVVLQLGEIALHATISEWKNDSVTCTLPLLGLTKASKATLHVVKADGKTASTMTCELVTTLPTSVEVAPASATDIDPAKYEQ